MTKTVFAFGKELPLWVLGSTVLVVAGAGGGAGAFLFGVVTGEASAAVDQAVYIDKENFSSQDIGGFDGDKVVALDDDGTGFTVAAEFHRGETMVMDVPLANVSETDIDVIATLKVSPGLDRDIDAFWGSFFRSTSPSSATTTPNPTPRTSITSQSSDTSPSTTTPPGIPGLQPQVSQGVPTASSPGLPAATPQPVNAAATTTKPSGSISITAQSLSASSTNTKPSGSIAITSQSLDASLTNTKPPGSIAVTAQSLDLTKTGTAASGVASVSAQTVDAAVQTTTPSGLSGLVASRSPDFTATTTEPSGTAAVSAQTADSTSTTTKPDPNLPGIQGTSIWYQGTFTVDADANGAAETIYFTLTDVENDNSIDFMDISTDDSGFGETRGGGLDGQSPRQTSEDDDERIGSSGTDVRLGSNYTFTLSYAANPASTTNDAQLVAKTWFLVTVTGTDLDGDESADDTFYIAFTDDDSDGLYEKFDFSIGDNVFGEGNKTDGTVNFSSTNNNNDERMTGDGSLQLGVNTFVFTFDTSPGASTDFSR